MLPTMLLAKTTAEDVFKSVGDSLDTKIEPNHIVLMVLGVIILVLLITLLGRHKSPVRVGKLKPLNNPSRLTRQIARQLGLSRHDLRRLNAVAAKAGVEQPLALLLCPSVLKSAAKSASPTPPDRV